MSEVGSYEAKTHLPKLLERVAKGERITITKHGRPVAMLVPVESKTSQEIEEVIRDIREFGKAHPRGDLSIREMIEEGRRF
jgi:prevent-host-death family protein